MPWRKGANSPPNVMRALQAAVPEKSIWLDGIEYVRIYSMKAMPPDFLDQSAALARASAELPCNAR